jgi:hypothetical protein
MCLSPTWSEVFRSKSRCRPALYGMTECAIERRMVGSQMRNAGMAERSRLCGHFSGMRGAVRKAEFALGTQLSANAGPALMAELSRAVRRPGAALQDNEAVPLQALHQALGGNRCGEFPPARTGPAASSKRSS